MPLGNGDIALNTWTEQNGDIMLLVAKADAWSENAQLLKLGRVRIALNPSPFTNAESFTQTLRLENGDVEFCAGTNIVRIWVDANHPAIRVEVMTETPTKLTATSELWRANEYHLDNKTIGRAQFGFWEWNSEPDGLTFDPDTVLPAKNNHISVCHFNRRSLYPLVFQREHLESLLPKYPDPILHRCFGFAMKGVELSSRDDQTLESAIASKSHTLGIYALTKQTDTPESWCAELDREIAEIDTVPLADAWKAHTEWWNQFWNRSWINVSAAPDAEKVSQGYAMQRYMTACASRGAQPVKHNGSLFTVGHDLSPGTGPNEASHDPDYRKWGASFWNQNCRHSYWPLLASGDYDLLAPWFNMYVKALPLVKDRTRLYYNHDGGAFIETIFFWGLPNVQDYGWNNSGPDMSSPWMKYHIQGGLEVVAQMLDYYDQTQDAGFAKNSLLPMADAMITFYDRHWKRDEDGKILMSPSQSIEMYQQTAVNPTPDIAGLKSTLPRLLALPAKLTTSKQRSLWTKVEKDLPPIPIGKTAKGKLPPNGAGDADGKPTILPAEKYGKSSNAENPELYAVFPYRIYGVGKSDLELAKNTFAARLCPINFCWGQDGMQAALLGLTGTAQNAALRALTAYGTQRFSWFWAVNKDWIPDMDNGGGGMMTLQLMLMQCDGRRIQLLPAWPKDWTADFKLHAPYQTTVEGHVEGGKITKMKVTPMNRTKDVVIVSGH
jgi:hypothetical protein